jgi:DNA-directed RNA polymerase subunit N (RpoN/RPB10)
MAQKLQDNTRNIEPLLTNKKILDDIGGVHDEAWWHQPATFDEKYLIVTIAARHSCGTTLEDYYAEFKSRFNNNSSIQEMVAYEWKSPIKLGWVTIPDIPEDGTRFEALSLTFQIIQQQGWI